MYRVILRIQTGGLTLEFARVIVRNETLPSILIGVDKKAGKQHRKLRKKEDIAPNGDK